MIEYLVSDEVYTTKGPTSDFQSDGASVVKVAMHVVCTKFTIAPGSAVRLALGAEGGAVPQEVANVRMSARTEVALTAARKACLA